QKLSLLPLWGGRLFVCLLQRRRYALKDTAAIRKKNIKKESSMNGTKFVLNEKDIPREWYNIQADLPQPLAPYLHPATKQPLGPADLMPLFPMELIKQEVSQE